MSHFVVLVINETPDSLENALAPFDEASEDPRFTQFKNIEASYRETFETETVEMVRLLDGSLKYPWDESFKSGKPFNEVVSYPEGAVKVQVPHRERYASFEEFMADWAGYDQRDPTHGAYGYVHNPNAKWDWYEIGGRWRGFFQLTAPAQDQRKQLHADVVEKRDWDLAGQRAQRMAEAGERYDAFFKLLDGRPLPPSWATVQAAHPDIEAARAAYWAHPTLQFLKDADPQREWLGFGACPGEEFAVSRETYLQQARARTAVPYAILKDGVWSQRGEMGWFGMSSDEKDPDSWEQEVAALLDALPDTATLIAVDCHI